MGNFTTVPDVTVGQSFPPSLWESAIMKNLNLGVCRQLADTTLAAAASTVSFASIPATFAHLLAFIYARTTSATTSEDVVIIQFNGDTGDNYDRQTLFAGGSSLSAADSYGLNGALVGVAAGGGSPASIFAASLLFIPAYAQTLGNKATLALDTAKWGVSSGDALIHLLGGFWRSSAAIGQITFLPGAGSFNVGSRFTLYGLPA